MNERILMIETSTECCSVALSESGRILASRIDETPRMQSSMLAPYIVEVLEEAGLRAADLDAVAVSEGPGSYTGLRVGVSTAKGICFGAGLPLIGVDTLQLLACQAEMPDQVRHDDRSQARIISFLDARRMEVYAATFDAEGRKCSDTAAVILDETSYQEELAAGPVLFIGTGVEKFQAICPHPNARFQPCFPLATAMLKPALAALQKKEFKDVAYFEPFYLKDFAPGVSKHAIL
jgi:tRNA threonylcarbamoyladenosine biosynthesis protein TsaB